MRAPPSRARALAAACALWALGTLALCLTASAPVLHHDTARDVLMARDCLELARCHQSGPPTSYAGLAQGTSWIRALELALGAGLHLRGVLWLFHGAIALLAGLLCLVHERVFARRGGALTGALFLLGAALASGAPVLWNPTLQVLPVALWFALLAAGSLRGSDAALALSGALLALALDGHPVALVLAAPTLLAGLGFARRPWLVAPAQGALFFASEALLSPRFFALNAAVFARFGLLLAGAVALCVPAGLALRRVLRAAPFARRAALLAHGTTLLSALGVALLVRVLGHHFAARYFVPALPAAATSLGLLAASLGERAGRAWPRASWAQPAAEALPLLLVSLLGARALRHLEPGAGRWTFTDSEVLLARLRAQGYGFQSTLEHLRGEGAYEQLAALAALSPELSRHAPREDREREDLLLVRTRASGAPSRLPPEWESFSLGHGDAALLGRVRSVLAGRELELCARTASDREEEALCALVPVSSMQLGNPVQTGLARYAYFTVAGVQRFADAVSRSPRRFSRLRYRLRGEFTEHERSRYFGVLRGEPAWRILRVEGARVDRALPASVARLDAEREGRAPFLLELESSLEGTALRPQQYWPPPLVEVPPVGPELLRAALGSAPGAPQ